MCTADVRVAFDDEMTLKHEWVGRGAGLLPSERRGPCPAPRPPPCPPPCPCPRRAHAAPAPCWLGLSRHRSCRWAPAASARPHRRCPLFLAPRARRPPDGFPVLEGNAEEVKGKHFEIRKVAAAEAVGPWGRATAGLGVVERLLLTCPPRRAAPAHRAPPARPWPLVPARCASARWRTRSASPSATSARQAGWERGRGRRTPAAAAARRPPSIAHRVPRSPPPPPLHPPHLPTLAQPPQLLVAAINKYYAFGSCFVDDST